MTVWLVMIMDYGGEYKVHSVWFSEASADKALEDSKEPGYVDFFTVQQ